MVETCRPEDLVPRVHSDTCTRCRKHILAGHRIVRVHISGGVGFNPNNMAERGIFLADEWEFSHVDCFDPMLKNRIGGM